jgi:tetratricopeptide (TPR) repeat protein
MIVQNTIFRTNLFRIQSFDNWKKSRLLASSDQDLKIRNALIEAEQLLQKGQKEQAIKAFNQVREQAKTGITYNLATQYLSFLEYENGNVLSAYQLLKSIKNDLAIDALCLLQKAAFEEKDYMLVIEVGSECYKSIPTVDTALRNGYAHAALKQVQPALGWLDTAVRDGLENISDIIAMPIFDYIREDSLFQEWVKKSGATS